MISFLRINSHSGRGSERYVDWEWDSRSGVGSSAASATLEFCDLETSLRSLSLGLQVCETKQGSSERVLSSCK